MSGWTLIAALLASATALWVAHVAYPIQKRRDRELKVDEERRAAYSTFLQRSEKMALGLVKRSSVKVEVLDGNDEDEIELSTALAILKLYAPRGIVSAAEGYEKAISSYQRALVAEKKERPAKVEGEKFVRTENYKAAIEKRHEAFKAMSKSRDDVAEKMRSSLGVDKVQPPGPEWLAGLIGKQV